MGVRPTLMEILISGEVVMRGLPLPERELAFLGSAALGTPVGLHYESAARCCFVPGKIIGVKWLSDGHPVFDVIIGRRDSEIASAWPMTSCVVKLTPPDPVGGVPSSSTAAAD